jgi:hypothetical protein
MRKPDDRIMTTYSGKCRRLDRSGLTLLERPCSVSLEEDTLSLNLAAGPPVSFDLGDVDDLSAGDYELALRLYTGESFVLSHFGKSFQNLFQHLRTAHRERVVQCLLLEDLDELLRVDGFVRLESTERELARTAELRLYRSNLAILPDGATGFQWRIADIDSLTFDDTSHAFDLRSGSERLIVSKLAKKTGEFGQRLREAMECVSERTARVLQRIFPFLAPEQFCKAAAFLKEGRIESIRNINAVDARIGPALIARTVDASLKPYISALIKRTAPDALYAGFKLIRREPGEPADEGEEDSGAEEYQELESVESIERTEPGAEDSDVLHWFFFPLRPASGSVPKDVAWEACSRSGRATYLFSLSSQRDPASADKAIRNLNRMLVTLNFRREPVYLAEGLLETERRYRRYAIACRRMPLLRELRTSFIGRAFHTSLQDWEKQIQDLLS